MWWLAYLLAGSEFHVVGFCGTGNIVPCLKVLSKLDSCPPIVIADHDIPKRDDELGAGQKALKDALDYSPKIAGLMPTAPGGDIKEGYQRLGYIKARSLLMDSVRAAVPGEALTFEEARQRRKVGE